MKSCVIIFPNQLFSEWHFGSDSEVFLVEEFLFFRQYKFHQQKIAFHRASMKFYESYLQKKGIKVHYIDSQNPQSDIRKLLSYLIDNQILNIFTFNPIDDWLEQRMRSFKEINWNWKDNPLFLNTNAEIEDYFTDDKRKFSQTDFYKRQRIQRNILLENQKPIGGKWTYDTENRKKFPKNKALPYINFPSATHYYTEAKVYVEHFFDDHIGTLSETPIYPTTFDAAQRWLMQFLENRFFDFGIYEDSIVSEAHFIHHSIISPLLNVGLLTPKEVLEITIDFSQKNEIPLNSLEGFIRQIIGWREFIRGIYLKKGTQQRNSNFWKHHKDIPSSFYDGTTGILPIDITIKKLLKTGYNHHIERLMLLANFMNLCGFCPHQIYQWFMEMYIDAYDWVMVPNVYGMALYADGGTMSTKPYISGSNYILKMSDYPKGVWEDIWNGLYWSFIFRNQDFFKGNPRLSIMVKSWDKFPDEVKRTHLNNANEFLKTLDQ